MGAVTEDQGYLGQVPFAHLLIRALDRRWTGTLKIQSPEGDLHTIELDRGLVARVLVGDGYAPVGRLLADAGVISENDLARVLKQTKLVGRALMKMGLIDEVILKRVLVLQLLHRLVRIFGLPEESQWAFSPDRDAFADMRGTPVRIDTLRVLWAGIMAHGELSGLLEQTLQRIAHSRFCVREGMDLARFGFAQDAAVVADALTMDALALDELLALELADPVVCEKIVYVLAITRYIDFIPLGVDDEPSHDPDSYSGHDDPISGVGEIGSGADTIDEDEPKRHVARIKLRRRRKKKHFAAAPDEPGTGHVHHVRRPGRRTAEPIAPGDASVVSFDSEFDPEAGAVSDITEGEVQFDENAGPMQLLDVSVADLRGTDEEVTDVLWEAYELAARRWHPDNVAHLPESQRQVALKRYNAVTAAFLLLSDEEKRNELIEATYQKPAGRRISRTVGGAEAAAMLAQMRQQYGPAEPSSKGRSKRVLTPLPGTMKAVRADETMVSPGQGRRKRGVGDVLDTHVSTKRGHPDLAYELHERALSLLAEDQLDEAYTLCETACGKEPHNLAFATTLVWIELTYPDADLDDGLARLDGILVQDPYNLTARFYRGIVLRILGYLDEAQRDFEDVLAGDPDYEGAQQQLDDMLAEQRQAR